MLLRLLQRNLPNKSHYEYLMDQTYSDCLVVHCSLLSSLAASQNPQEQRSALSEMEPGRASSLELYLDSGKLTSCFPKSDLMFQDYIPGVVIILSMLILLSVIVSRAGPSHFMVS